ncbi:MAG TPA: TetR/AcrR family transcriptional regulator [Baekduia sp.]|uniref:TetR/AcrR family transcriptional regulator n=1 Tax=Baekduia sp. TaxID=2600305 RepID=UPI002D791BCC|nr:TetR/AcrR family transcriptional regulator [Baekduia sp.]HET6505876.1 TetR/AcrR family transcriptional regulator [Baekduia sp.]
MTPAPRLGSLEPKQDRSRATRRLLLDAAVDELLEHGYQGLTTLAVAQRAGVSRGAAQGHFPQKTALVGEALRHLAEREVQAVRDVVETASGDPRARAQAALDFLFEQFSGPLFATVTELALASRGAPELQAAVEEEERAMSTHVTEVALELFGAERVETPGFTTRWNTALAAIRGVALLRLLRHSPQSTRRLWAGTRGDLLDMLLPDDEGS